MIEIIEHSKFKECIDEFYNKAKEYLVIMSPFIDLPVSFFNATCNNKINMYRILFGNTDDVIYKALNNKDFDILYRLGNVKINHRYNLQFTYLETEKQSIYATCDLLGNRISDNPIIIFKTIIESNTPNKEMIDYFKKGNSILSTIHNEKILFEIEENNYRSFQVKIPSSVENKFSNRDSSGYLSKTRYSDLLEITKEEFINIVEQLGYINNGNITQLGYENGLIMDENQGNSYIKYPKGLITEKDVIKYN